MSLVFGREIEDRNHLAEVKHGKVDSYSMATCFTRPVLEKQQQQQQQPLSVVMLRVRPYIMDIRTASVPGRCIHLNFA